MDFINEIVNFFMFYSFVGAGVAFLMIGKYYNMHNKQNLPWIFLSVGLIVIAFRSFFQSLPEIFGLGAYMAVIVPVVSIVGSVLIIMSIGLMLMQKKMEKTSLQKRYDDIHLVLENLHQKYFRKEISEDDMRKMNADLEKELAEIEVKLKGEKQI